MDFDLRQWLLILGPIFVVGVLLHGYLRMRAGQNNIRMKLDKNFTSKPGDEPDVDELNLLKAELPNGGARVIRRDEASSGAGDIAAEEQASPEKPDEQVPMLMESVELPSIRATDPEPEVTPAAGVSAAEPVAAEPVAESRAAAQQTRSAPAAGSSAAEKAPVAKKKAPPARKAEAPPTSEPASAKASGKEPRPEKFVVVNVLALAEPFPGQQLLGILQDAGMTFGEMDIYHRLDEQGEPMFSLANAVEPGTFDPAAMKDFSTPGVTLFMRVHELSDPLSVLDEVLAVADRMALEMNGEIRDETRSVMTPQTIEHCRQSIREFQFRHSA